MSNLRYSYTTLEFGNSTDIHVRTLRDNQQFSDPDGAAARCGISAGNWPLFGIIWPSGEVLAHLMHAYPLGELKILEVGCGIGLASLVLNQRQADITATDYHPAVAGFLAENVRINDGDPIPFIRADWAETNEGLGQFDLIIGSDLLYEQWQAEDLANFIQRHAAPVCQVILVDPGRPHHARFSKDMVARGFSHRQERPDTSEFLDQPFKGQVLYYARQARVAGG